MSSTFPSARAVARGLSFLLSVTGVSWAGASSESGVRFASISWSKGTASAEVEGGARVELGLDDELTRLVTRSLEDARPIAGAAVLVDVESGRVLAASEVGHGSHSLLLEPVAPAASVFKLVTTAALYEKTQVTPQTRVCTDGGLRDISERHLHPASGPLAVCAPFGQALGVSRNAAYAQLATTALLRDDLVDLATRFGFNGQVLLDSQARMGELVVPYNDLEFARTATGFENSTLSVFGGAQLALTVATGGLHRTMHLVKHAPSPQAEPRILSAQTAARLRRSMEITVHSGTAREAFVDERGRSRLGPIQAAGKTGTLRLERGGPTSSWFVGFAPSQKPEVVVSVLLQNPERWHRKGHQVARDLLAAYFKGRGVRGIDLP